MEVIHNIALAVLIADGIALVCYLGYMVERNYKEWKRKKALLLLLLLLPLGFMSCEKPDLIHVQLEDYYDESMSLKSCTCDSVTRFSSKVKTFVADFPEAKDDPLYPPILRNIHDAWMLLDVNGTGWDGEETIGFTFGD